MPGIKKRVLADDPFASVVKEFDVRLEKPEGIDSAYLVVPFDVAEAFGRRSLLRVKVTFDGYVHRGAIMPDGKGKHYMGLNRSVREAIGKSAGDIVHVTMQLDTEERIVDVPEAFSAALVADGRAKARFERLPYSHRREYVEWIESARRPETRSSRIHKAIEMLKAGVKEP